MATQKGRNWSSGDIVTAANLSSIERGVSAVAEEYTPTTWANGNTVTAAALNNIEQGLANAGGSSDFSVANVTFINSAEGYHYDLMHFPRIGDDRILITQGAVEVRDSITVVIPLYKGKALIELSPENPEYTDMQVMPTFTGGVSFVQGGMLVTGDGSVTFAGTQSNSGGGSNTY